MRDRYVQMKEVLKRYWLVACRESELGRKPVGVTVLDEPVVLFRTGRGIHALRDVCPHRRVPLSKGWVKEEAIVCPYHGWEFSGEGVCRRVPGLMDDACKKQIRATALPVRVRDGFVWIKLRGEPGGNEEAEENGTKEPFDLSFLRDPSLYSFIWKVGVKGNLVNAFENLLDGTHTHFVHAGLIRTDSNRQQVSAKLTAFRDHVEIEYSGESKQAGLISQLLERDRQTSYGRFFMPGIAQIEYRSRKGLSMLITAVARPVSEAVQDVYAIITVKRGIVPNFIKRLVIAPFFKMALKQDLRIVELQQNWIERCGEGRFVSTEADLMRPFIEQLTKGRRYDKPFKREVKLLL